MSHKYLSSSSTFSDVILLNNYSQQAALHQLCKTSHWHSAIGMTLNLKQSIVTEASGFLMVDELRAKAAFRDFMNRLNRRIYKSSYRHRGKRLRVVPILEKSAEGRWHYHLAIEPPAFTDPSDFGEIAMTCWLSTPLGYDHGDVTINVDAGWATYMLKLRGKSGLESYVDCIDIEALYNPLDC
jgi:hypothetical protein